MLILGATGSAILWSIPAGLIAGFVLGFLGAGGTVVALPVLLVLAHLRPHLTLGTNALGVALTASGLLSWRIRQHEVRLSDGIAFAAPGLPGIYVGARLGLLYPGAKLVFLLGFLLFIVAAWMYYLSMRQGQAKVSGQNEGPRSFKRSRLLKMIPTALAVGMAAGFFGVGGGFMIVPGLMLTGGLGLAEAVAASLLPITCFAGLIGVEYLRAGSVVVSWALVMMASGLVGGAYGIWLAKHLSKVTMLRVFAVFLALLGVYMLFR
jgi:uncharacterized protein